MIDMVFGDTCVLVKWFIAELMHTSCVTRLGMCVCGVTAHSSPSVNHEAVRDKMFLYVEIENLDPIQEVKQSTIAS